MKVVISTGKLISYCRNTAFRQQAGLNTRLYSSALDDVAYILLSHTKCVYCKLPAKMLQESLSSVIC